MIRKVLTDRPSSELRTRLINERKFALFAGFHARVRILESWRGKGLKTQNPKEEELGLDPDPT